MAQKLVFGNNKMLPDKQRPDMFSFVVFTRLDVFSFPDRKLTTPVMPFVVKAVHNGMCHH